MSALKNAKANYLIVGIFVIASIIALIFSIALLTGRTGAVDTYFTKYDRVQGLKFGTQVVYEGFPVGQIEEIIPVREDGRMRFLVELSIAEGWDIPDDSLAAVSSAGLLSALTINIRAGRSDVVLKPGENIQGLENADMFAAMSTLAEEIAVIMETDVKPLMASLNTAVSTATVLLAEDGGEIAKKLHMIMDDISVRTPEIGENIALFTKDLNTSSQELTKILTPKNRQTINEALGDLAKLSNTLDKADHLVGNMDDLVTEGKPELEKAISDLQFVMATLSRHIDNISQNMESTSRNLFEFSRHIRQNPGLLLGGQPPSDNAQ